MSSLPDDEINLLLDALSLKHHHHEGDGVISIFCYGSSPNNGKPGATMAYACVVPTDPDFDEAHAIDDESTATNQRAILYAAIAALRIAETIDPEATRPLEIVSNSEYLNKAMNDYIETWARNGWRTSKKKPVKNQDLLQTIWKAMADGRKREWKHFENDIDAYRQAWAQRHHQEAERRAQRAAPDFAPRSP